MVQLAPFAVALVAAVTGTSAFHTPCPFGRVLCGYTLNSGDFGYTRSALITALLLGGQDPNIEDVIEHSLFTCVDEEGGIEVTPEDYCGVQGCIHPEPGNPHNPGPDAICEE